MKTIQLQFLMRSNRRALSIKPGDLNLNQDTAVGSIKSGHLSLLLALLHQQMRQLEEINPQITSPCLWFTYSLVVYSFWSFGNKEVTLILGNHCVEITSVLSRWVISVFWLLWTILCEYLYSVNPVFLHLVYVWPVILTNSLKGDVSHDWMRTKRPHIPNLSQVATMTDATQAMCRGLNLVWQAYNPIHSGSWDKTITSSRPAWAT